MAQIPDAQLVEAARKGDVDSFGELCRRHYACMVGVAYCILSDRHLAEDAAQETFAVACRDLRRLRRPGNFGPWLRAICRNVSRSMARSKTALTIGADVPAPAAQNPGSGASQLVRRSVERLPAAEREVVVLRYFSGLTYEQIGAALGISARAVNGRLTRAKRRIAEDLRRSGLGRRIS